MLSIDKPAGALTSNRVPFSYIIGVGDSAQRFCADNRVKLSRTRCVFLPSLSPHNVSGLPGLLLGLSDLVSDWKTTLSYFIPLQRSPRHLFTSSQGCGSLTIIAPVGIRGLLDSMAAFTNRKYPVLDVIEVGGSYENNKSVKVVGDVLEVKEDSMRILVKPVYVMSSSTDEGRRPIAIAAVFQYTETTAGMSVPLSVIPIEGRGVGAGSFATDPSLGDLTKWASSAMRTVGIHSPVGLFFPLSVHSVGINATESAGAGVRAGLTAAARALRKSMQTCCAKYNITGIRIDVGYTLVLGYCVSQDIRY
jgi:hypothetical protein